MVDHDSVATASMKERLCRLPVWGGWEMEGKDKVISESREETVQRKNLQAMQTIKDFNAMKKGGKKMGTVVKGNTQLQRQRGR